MSRRPDSLGDVLTRDVPYPLWLLIATAFVPLALAVVVIVLTVRLGRRPAAAARGIDNGANDNDTEYTYDAADLMKTGTTTQVLPSTGPEGPTEDQGDLR